MRPCSRTRACSSSYRFSRLLLVDLEETGFTWIGAFYIWPDTTGLFARFEGFRILLYSSATVLAIIGLAVLWREDFQFVLLMIFILAFLPAIYCVTQPTFGVGGDQPAAWHQSASSRIHLGRGLNHRNSRQSIWAGRYPTYLSARQKLLYWQVSVRVSLVVPVTARL